MEKKGLPSNTDKVECCWNDSIFYIEPKIFFEAVFLQKRGTNPYVRYRSGAELFGIGRTVFIKLAKDAEAVHKYNGTAFVDVEKVCRFIDGLNSGD